MAAARACTSSTRADLGRTRFIASPGHHFQLSIERERTDVPPILRVTSYLSGEGFTEGWASYAEWLADEVGLNDHPAERLAFFRTSRPARPALSSTPASMGSAGTGRRASTRSDRWVCRSERLRSRSIGTPQGRGRQSPTRSVSSPSSDGVRWLCRAALHCASSTNASSSSGRCPWRTSRASRGRRCQRTRERVEGQALGRMDDGNDTHRRE